MNEARCPTRIPAGIPAGRIQFRASFAGVFDAVAIDDLHAFSLQIGVLLHDVSAAARKLVIGNKKGQGTVEAAFLLPVLCVLVLLLVQPGILLYDRMVMEGAAADACRLLVTKADSWGVTDEQCEDYVRHRLGAVPQQDCFHVHDSGCTWDIRLEGDEAAQSVRVSISTEVRPLPLLGAAGELLGIVNERGNFEVKVSIAQQTQPEWVESSSVGRDPSSWIGAWLDEA